MSSIPRKSDATPSGFDETYISKESSSSSHLHGVFSLTIMALPHRLNELHSISIFIVDSSSIMNYLNLYGLYLFLWTFYITLKWHPGTENTVSI